MKRRGFFGLLALGVTLTAAPARAEETPSALHFAGTIYATNAAVALRADRDCRGERCTERLYSLVPVVGGFAQLAHGGFVFHDNHHGVLCVPLTFGAVGGQLIGLAAHASGVDLSLAGPHGARLQLSVVPYEDAGPAAGLGFAWIQ